VSLVGSGATWHSTALSYGVIPVAESDVEPLTRFVKEYERIRKIEDERERRVEEVEWIVRLVEFPLLSWEGAFELNAGRYLPVGSSTWETYARDLTPEQWERLTVVLLGSTELTGDLLELVRDRRDPRVLAWYLDRIAASAEDPPWNLEHHLHWFSGILPDQELKTWIIATWQIRVEEDERRDRPWIFGWFRGTDEEEAAAIRSFVVRARAALLPP
jgi:hypothetical protein